MWWLADHVGAVDAQQWERDECGGAGGGLHAPEPLTPPLLLRPGDPPVLRRPGRPLPTPHTRPHLNCPPVPTLVRQSKGRIHLILLCYNGPFDPQTPTSPLMHAKLWTGNPTPNLNELVHLVREKNQ